MDIYVPKCSKRDDLDVPTIRGVRSSQIVEDPAVFLRYLTVANLVGRSYTFGGNMPFYRVRLSTNISRAPQKKFLRPSWIQNIPHSIQHTPAQEGVFRTCKLQRYCSHNNWITIKVWGQIANNKCLHHQQKGLGIS